MDYDVRLVVGIVLSVWNYYYYHHYHPCYITFMQSIYNYIPETNHVSSIYGAVASQYLQFVLHVMLFRP